MNPKTTSRSDGNSFLGTFRRPRLNGLLAGLLGLGGIAWQPGVLATDAPVARGAAPIALTPAQIRVAIEDAERRSAAAFRPDPSVPQSIEHKWGVQIIRIDYTANGYWLGFRFRVTDADKARPLFDSRIKPYVESEKSGVKLGVPTAAKVGALRTTDRGGNIKPGKIYNMIFGNVGAQIKPGDKVSVVVGDFKVEHLRVN